MFRAQLLAIFKESVNFLFAADKSTYLAEDLHNPYPANVENKVSS
jgi:hypothetical protein